MEELHKHLKCSLRRLLQQVQQSFPKQETRLVLSLPTRNKPQTVIYHIWSPRKHNSRRAKCGEEDEDEKTNVFVDQMNLDLCCFLDSTVTSSELLNVANSPRSRWRRHWILLNWQARIDRNSSDFCGTATSAQKVLRNWCHLRITLDPSPRFQLLSFGGLFIFLGVRQTSEQNTQGPNVGKINVDGHLRIPQVMISF